MSKMCFEELNLLKLQRAFHEHHVSFFVLKPAWDVNFLINIFGLSVIALVCTVYLL